MSDSPDRCDCGHAWPDHSLAGNGYPDPGCLVAGCSCGRRRPDQPFETSFGIDPITPAPPLDTLTD